MNHSVVMLLICLQQAHAQFSGSNQASFRIGNQPGVKPADQSSLYDQLNLRYSQQHFIVGLRAEFFQTDAPAEYNRFSQKFVRFNSDDLQLQVGNFHEILGRGTLLRSFEIPGSIYEVSGQRYGFYKDIEGVSLRYQNNFMNTKFLYGRPLDRSLPPAFGEKIRRPALVYGGEINLLFHESITPGILFLEKRVNQTNTAEPQKKGFAGMNLEGLLSDNIQYYMEYTADKKDFTDNSRAFYSSASVGLGRTYITGEYKYYNDFLLVFNDPPPAVREHPYTLLNRATHVTNLINESGYQLEVLFNLGDFNTVTINHARGVNEINDSEDVYQSYYMDLNYYFSDQSLLKTFIDFAGDESEFRYDMYTLGASLEFPLFNLWSVSFDAQYQKYRYDLPFSPVFGNLDQDIKNGLLSFFISHSPEFSIGSSVELSNDNRETDPDFKKDREIFLSWPSFNLSYQYNQQNTFSFFYGKRRGGNACSGGVCYQVLPFAGLEITLNSRF